MSNEQGQSQSGPADPLGLIRNGIIRHMDARQTDLVKLGNQANDQEFTVCRFLLTWSIAAIALVLGHLLTALAGGQRLVDLTHFWFLFSALIVWGLSVLFGVIHHFYFIFLMRGLARKFDEANLSYYEDLQKGVPGLLVVHERIRKEYAGKSIFSGKPYWLYSQAGFFVLGATVVGLSLLLASPRR